MCFLVSLFIVLELEKIGVTGIIVSDLGLIDLAKEVRKTIEIHISTQLSSMNSETIKLLKDKCPDCKVCVGGAVLTQEYADMIGADFYGKDALDTVKFAQQIFTN